ncbi:sperm-associated antigen 6-like isoform X3 [Neodiprion virginianus]|uniref:sperm-associated antigen 6-like isoform X3 n=1 Tax=Neodiprion virginianus TaxID=2961670 RepID=UPI001EE6CB50|nr:sperm-associated antigen 6-like isoform X3 [Neodiprion virginianus]
MTARVILQVFDQYQKARVSFVQTVADLASRPQNVDCLENAGVLDLLRPLLSDVVPSIQQTAAIALGRLANHDDRVAQAVIRRDIMPQLLRNIDKQNKFFKKAALFVLRAVAKHSPEMASVIVHGGGLEAMVICLEDFDLGVKEAAAWALGYVARHNKSLAQAAIDTGAVPLLVLCLQEPELCLKQISASALCDISKHSEDLAQIVVDAGAVPFLAKAISNPDPKLKINIYYLLQRQVLSALSSIAKHSVELAEIIVEAEVFPDVLVHMAHPDDNVDRAAANLTRDVCKHTLELAQLIVNTGGIGALVELVGTSKSDSRLPAIMALGYIAGHSDQLAIAVIGSKGVVQLAIVLQEETEDHILSITVWALGQIGKHTPEHAKALAVADVFRKLLEILPNDARARRMFVTTGGLKKVQEIQAEPGSMLLEFITIINCCFPEEIVRYYSPGYPDTLLEAVEQYQPKCPSVFTMDQKMSDEFSNSSMSLLHYNEERG